MLEIDVAIPARRDIGQVLHWSEKSFGTRARQRYQKLITKALHDLAKDPFRSESVGRPDIAPGYRVYHLHHSRKRAERAGPRVQTPRHFFLYRVRDETVVHVARLLHDSMDMEMQVSRQPLE